MYVPAALNPTWEGGRYMPVCSSAPTSRTSISAMLAVSRCATRRPSRCRRCCRVGGQNQVATCEPLPPVPGLADSMVRPRDLDVDRCTCITEDRGRSAAAETAAALCCSHPPLQEGHDLRRAPEQQHADHPRKVARRHAVQRARLHTTALASCAGVNASCGLQAVGDGNKGSCILIAPNFISI